VPALEGQVGQVQQITCCLAPRSAFLDAVEQARAVVDPPEAVAAGEVLLRRATVADAAGLAAVVADSLDHLAAWMPWATPEAATVDAQRERVAGGPWGPDSYHYLIIRETVGVVGGCGLHRRIGPTGLEIGYWVGARHTRQGYASAAAAALTRTALSLPGIDRVEIHCDEANVASAAVARRLGYALDRIDDHTVDSPAQTGRFMIWVTRAHLP
jgi:RimJ/RimL family protein N-acetyltransferase